MTSRCVTLEVMHFRGYDARMTTKNPRLTITLKPATSAQLVALSRLTGQSQSSLIAEILESSSPVFDRMIQVLEAATQAKQELKHRMASDLEGAQGRLEQQLGIVMNDFDAFTGDLLEDAEGVSRRARRSTPIEGLHSASGERRARSTPPSNRGVRSTANPPKTAKSKKGPTHGQV